MINNIKQTNFATDIIQFNISHLSIKTEFKTENKKPMFKIDNAYYKVEEFSKIFFINNDYQVFNGNDINLYFSFLSYNFKDSFFQNVCCNYITDSKLLNELEIQVNKTLSNNQINSKLFKLTIDLLADYYKTYLPKEKIYYNISTFIEKLDNDLLIKIIKFYKKIGYITKGIPDLFIIKNNCFSFVEVKSLNDSLSHEQYNFFENYITIVGDYIFVLRVL